jgi:type II pantothenate kinase
VNPSTIRTRVGIDAGSTLIKLAIRGEGGPLRLELAPADAFARVARDVGSLAPARVAVTGGGAERLARALGATALAVGEFDAWAAGARALLEVESHAAAAERFLLVSVGTGTSCVLVDGETVTRVGGTALGGGTLLGLGAALTGRSAFDEIVALAAAGDRGRVDLLVSDVYPDGLPELPGAATAANFGKLAQARRGGGSADPRDLAGALVGLVGENVALLCNALAAQVGVRTLVFGGSALRANPPLANLLVAFTAAFGREPVLLARAEHAGAIGALLAAERGDT